MLILIGNSYGIFYRGKDVLGVEFAGGETVTLSFNQAHKIGVDRLREAASRARVSARRSPIMALITRRPISPMPIASCASSNTACR